MDETSFHAIADATLLHCFDRCEAAYDAGAIDELELGGGILTITVPGGRTYLVSKHTPSCEVWLASPVSGGLHFRHKNETWCLSDGTTLYNTLQNELAAEGITVAL